MSYVKTLDNAIMKLIHLRLLRAQQRKIVDGKEYRRWKKFEPIQEGHNGQD